MTQTRTRTDDLVDAVTVLGTLTLVLTLLDESFWSRAYLVAGLVPVGFLLLLAWFARRLADGVWIYCLVAIVSFVPLGALAALQAPGPWIVPTVDTMQRVLGETWVAPQLFVNTLPPVEASGTLLLLPYAIGFGAALPTAWLALGGRRPVAPAVAVVAGLAATIPVAVLVPDHYILRGAALTVWLMTWATVRARRAEAVVGQRRAVIATSLVAAILVAAVAGVVGVLTPDDDQTDRSRLRPSADDAVGSQAADSLGPPTGGSAVLLRASGVPDGARLRFGALDLYDGTAWVPADESPGAGGTGTFRRLGREVDPVHDGPEVDVRVRIRPAYDSDWLPTLGELTRLELDYRDGRTQLEDVRYNQATSSAVVLGGVDPRDDYTFTSVLTPDGFRQSDRTMEPDPEQEQPEAAFLDEFLRPFDRAGLSPLQRVLLVARYLRQNGAVRLSGTSSQDPVDLGLRLIGAEDIVATPFQYSAATALAASRLGVPARVVVGAEPGRGGLVRERDVESWVELQFADGTWRTLEPHRYTGVHAYTEDSSDDEALDAGGWVRAEIDRDDSGIKIPRGADIELSPDAVFEERTDPWTVLGLTLAAIAAAVLIAWWCVPGVKAVRRGHRSRAHGSALYVNGWQEVLDTARDRGTPVPEWWGRVAQARVLGVGSDLARRADAAVFAPVDGTDQDARAFWEDCRVLCRDLVEEVDARHQWWALLNPASLLAGWARRRGAGSVGAVRHEDRRARGEQPARA